MTTKFRFVSGLPRAGSTLLMNILAQNPALRCSKSTSGLHDVMFGVRNNWDKLIEHQAEEKGPDLEKLARVLASIMEGYYGPHKPEGCVDKGRGWLSLIEMTEAAMGEKARIVVPVRDLAEIVASFEKLWRANAGTSQQVQDSADYFAAQTIIGRARVLLQGNMTVGLAVNRLRDAIDRGLGDRLYLMDFDTFCAGPEEELKKIYEFWGFDWYEDHDFENVEQVTSERDGIVHGIPGLHTIRKKVSPVPHCADQILGAPFSKELSEASFWKGYFVKKAEPETGKRKGGLLSPERRDG